MSKDATDATFAADVVERSRDVPVVVDFWAEWCGPCRQLTPVLEAVVDAHAGQVELVKVDVDQNPRTALAYRVQGIPAVNAFKGGILVDEFTGAVPRATVEAFVARLLPSEADRLAAAGDADSLRRALELDPRHPVALGGLARLELGTEPAAARGVELLEAGELAAGLDALLEALRSGDAELRERIRQVMVGVFSQLGQSDPLASEYRRRLASALY